MSENPWLLIILGLIAVAPGSVALIRTWKTDNNAAANADIDQRQEDLALLEDRYGKLLARADALDAKLSRVNQKLWLSMEFNHAQQIHARSNGLTPLPWPQFLIETN